ncbi:hypothetical protein U9M48_008483 [Paspalum notatum var. saurae]|uniref:Uncharacterized protein n=1 Tax=Paspalum notatum var. saurae TaxID=547442 RepID=A0AAQ3SPM9_PASNO
MSDQRPDTVFPAAGASAAGPLPSAAALPGAPPRPSAVGLPGAAPLPASSAALATSSKRLLFRIGPSRTASRAGRLSATPVASPPRQVREEEEWARAPGSWIRRRAPLLLLRHASLPPVAGRLLYRRQRVRWRLRLCRATARSATPTTTTTCLAAATSTARPRQPPELPPRLQMPYVDPLPSQPHQAEMGMSSIFPKRVKMLSIAHCYSAALTDRFMKFLSGKKLGDCKLIVSTYNYKNTPSVQELLILVAQIQATVANIVRIETAAADIVDVSTMFQVVEHCQVKSQLHAYLNSLDLPNETSKPHIPL